MTDNLTRSTRSLHMSRIRGRDTQPELIVRRGLHRAGLRFRLHRRDLPGRPDIVLPKYNAVVFVNGCFWHRHKGCHLAYIPKSRGEFWSAKFATNVARDRNSARKLRKLGWRVFVIWECKLRSEHSRQTTIDSLIGKIRASGYS